MRQSLRCRSLVARCGALITVLIAAVTLATAPVVYGQLQTGNLYGQVLDQQGMALPGVTITLIGDGAPQVQVSNAQGEFRFLGVPPSVNRLTAELEGFAAVEYRIPVNVGRNTTFAITLVPAIDNPNSPTTNALPTSGEANDTPGDSPLRVTSDP